jgi:glyoxylase-like metal-dependent hydrolase (beta-lactamase superfamily II)
MARVMDNSLAAPRGVPSIDRVAPVDPRLGLSVPALGQLPQVLRLEDLVTRILAPNPGLWSLDGTNTYVVCAPGAAEAAVVDPGPADYGHLARVEAALASLGARCRWILVTHHHIDHAEAALPWAARLGATVAAGSQAVAGPGGRLLADGDRVELPGTGVEVVATPGHCRDHLAFRLESGTVLVGDHILGRGTSVITYPEGDLLAYLDSLRRVHDLGPAALYPGHGPEMRDDPSAVIEYYLAQRQFREQQILAVLGGGPLGIRDIVEQLYVRTDRGLLGAAEQSTRATLHKMRAEGTVAIDRHDVVSRPEQP